MLQTTMFGVLKRWKWIRNSISICLIVMFCCSGCAEKDQQFSELQSDSNDVLLQSEQNEWTNTINEKFGNIDSEESAGDAVNSLVVYMADRFEQPDDELVVQGVLPSNVDILYESLQGDVLAKQEYTIRSSEFMAQQIYPSANIPLQFK